MSKEKVTDTIIDVATATSYIAAKIAATSTPSLLTGIGVSLGIISAPILAPVAGAVVGVANTTIVVMGIYKIVTILKK